MMNSLPPKLSDQPEGEYPHWNRVYIAVLVTTALVILALWLFSEAYTPSY